jgi:hypothetical protein
MLSLKTDLSAVVAVPYKDRNQSTSVRPGFCPEEDRSLKNYRANPGINVTAVHHLHKSIYYSLVIIQPVQIMQDYFAKKLCYLFNSIGLSLSVLYLYSINGKSPGQTERI